MALLGSILLAVFVAPPAWRVPVVLAGIAVEVLEAWIGLRWSRRRAPRVGVETMVGRRAVVSSRGWVRIDGERWQARGETEAAPGTEVVVEAVDGLTLVVREV